MSKTRLPAAIQSFVDEHGTTPVEDLWKDGKSNRESPYGSHWYRAIACMMLSNRVRPKHDGNPDMTEVNRIGKEANFNQYLFERVAKFLVATKVVAHKYDGPYTEGPNIGAFWQHDTDRLPTMTQQALLRLIDKNAGYRNKGTPIVDKAHLIELVTLFFACFRGRALLEKRLGIVLQGFAELPKDDLVHVARELGLAAGAVDPEGWNGWLDLRARKALIEAVGVFEWAYYADREGSGWVFASPTGLGMLGLDKPLPAPELAKDFKAGPSLSVVAGAGLALQKLVPLFRHCVIKRIREVFEFRLDPKRLALSPAGTSPGEELRKALHELEPLPDEFNSLLGTKSKLGGVVGIRGCSALVKPENKDVLAAIRAHPSLKGYLEPGAPPGYLLIKPQSDPSNFVQRCLNLGFKVEELRGTGGS